ncbi:sulfotransferase domain-containing protein [Nocardioides mangrovi]|uniref:Sulfotransferase domain-containing protein n=1 Tax=Nocardioides mangrovi TaxID=2874580 RepID=A0ABS7UFY9_9ACTN|nr:sulfotransferase domain-containing protein [Nocardioides mangrovi]MBZ5739740.1 sulfotransferase domain-containing protein [Nocardioides mangrovi]
MASTTEIKARVPRPAMDLANWTTRQWGLATAARRGLPDFLVIGTKRGGTTSLFNYLLMHPGILGLYPQVRGRKSTDYFFRNLHLGEPWYRSHFHTDAHLERATRRLGYRPQSGEASPFYMWDERIPERVHELAPSVKAIALVRDPVERAWSHYQERVQNGVEPLSFPEALEAEERRTAHELERMRNDPDYHADAWDWYAYRQRGVYLPQLETWTATFPREQLLVLRSEDMYADVQSAFDTTCEFLGLPSVELPTRKTFNASARAPMPESVRAELTDFYAPHNARLEAFLGRSLHWS